MILSDQDILDLLSDGHVFGVGRELAVTPLNKHNLQPAGIDVCLDRFFRVFNHNPHLVIDPGVYQPELTREVSVDPAGEFVLHPGAFVLGCTQETMSLGPTLAAQLLGKSSLARLGLQVHATAGWIDPGFSGQITLELSNVAPLPLRLRPGMLIAQLAFLQLSSPAVSPYGSGAAGSRYQNQQGPTPSRAHLGLNNGLPVGIPRLPERTA